MEKNNNKKRKCKLQFLMLHVDIPFWSVKVHSHSKRDSLLWGGDTRSRTIRSILSHSAPGVMKAAQAISITKVQIPLPLPLPGKTLS
jgi:hypothetical protein